VRFTGLLAIMASAQPGLANCKRGQEYPRIAGI